MKRCVAFLALLCIMLCGCSQKPEYDAPASFYYPRVSILYGENNGVIASESREASGYEADLLGLLNLYLAGPETQDLRNPFPEGCSVLSATVASEICTVILDDSFADLTGMELSLACTSLGMTASKISGCKTVVIRAETRLLDGEETRIYNASTLQLSDDYIPETQP